MNFKAEKRKMPGGPYITGRVEGGKESRFKEGGWTFPWHTTSVNLVPLSAESQVHRQTEARFSSKTGLSFILLCCLTQHTFSSVVIRTVCLMCQKRDIIALICHILI